jgi:hypothetical protein
MHSWQTDELDLELKDRIEKSKSKKDDGGSRWEAS